ncbi:protein Mis18-beta [Sarcophilus harrisii]|uniref:Opa interacting protein 5 n=1 Tax=Sarcophilus harrisii TaxID=9305 RepID=G3WWT4_SARHA|nr:protein Mis18-beta [Sarcophilus harrisii]
MRRSSRRKRGPRAEVKTEGEAEEEEEGEEKERAAAAASKRSGRKSLGLVFEELEAQAARERRRVGEPSVGEETSFASMEWETKAAKRSCPLRPRGLRGDEAVPGPSSLPDPPGPAAPEKSEFLENMVVFQCLGCFAVLGDSVHLCREETRLLSILVFSRLTNNVILDKSLLVGIEGGLLGSTYNPLFCHSCGLSIGFRLYSTYATLSDLKGLFCLFKDSIVCYLLKTKSVVNASEMEFPTKHLSAQISKLKEKIMMMDSHLTKIIRELKRMIHGPLDIELE